MVERVFPMEERDFRFALCRGRLSNAGKLMGEKFRTSGSERKEQKHLMIRICA